MAEEARRGGSGVDPVDIEIGPVDYVVLEWSDGRPNGAALPHLIDLVDRGVIRIIDIVFVAKAEDGTITEIAVDQLGAEFAVFEGVGSDLIDADDVAEATSALEPGTAAAILVWENVWAAPFVSALRSAGAQVVASGRVPVAALLETLEAAER